MFRGDAPGKWVRTGRRSQDHGAVALARARPERVTHPAGPSAMRDYRTG